MRQEKRSYTHTQVYDTMVYIADDGKEFVHKSDCIQYELDKAREEAKGKIITCDELEGKPNIDGGEYVEHHGYTWVFVRNGEDAEMLNRMFLLDYDDFSCHIGQWVCVEESEDSSWLSNIENGIKYAKELLDKLGYNVEITRKDEQV